MSLVFSDTSTYKGLVQRYEKEIGANYGDISGNTTALKELAADFNLAFDEFLPIAIQAGGTHQYDDSNHSDYPIITTNIVSGQRDYAFTADGSSNLILDIYKVLIADSSGTFRDLKPVDVQSETDTLAFSNATSGAPSRYDKTGNGVFLDPVPNYNYSGGLKLYVNREPSYFAYTDTTKKPGVPGPFHEWFVLCAAYKHPSVVGTRREQSLLTRKLRMEEAIKEYFGARAKDERVRLRAGTDSNK